MVETTERRDDICPWKDMDHLKNTYSKHMTPKQIDEIVERITKDGTFKKREGSTEIENNDHLLNLVDSIIMKELKL